MQSLEHGDDDEPLSGREGVEYCVQISQLDGSRDVRLGDLKTATPGDEEGDSEGLPSPLEGAWFPRDQGSWLSRLSEILKHQTNAQARQAFWEQVPSLGWSPARTAGNAAGDTRPSPPGPTPYATFAIPNMAQAHVPSSPPLLRTQAANTPQLDSSSAERTPSPVVTPTPAIPKHSLKQHAKAQPRKHHQDRTFHGVIQGRVHKSYSLRNRGNRPLENGAEALLSRPPRRLRALRSEPDPALKNDRLIGDQVLDSYQGFPWIPVRVKYPHAPTDDDDDCLDPFLVTACSAAILTQEARPERDSIHKVLRLWEADWAKTPWDLNDAQLDNEIAIFRSGLDFIHQEVASSTHILDVTRTIIENISRAENCRALPEILLYGMLRIARRGIINGIEVRVTRLSSKPRMTPDRSE